MEFNSGFKGLTARSQTDNSNIKCCNVRVCFAREKKSGFAYLNGKKMLKQSCIIYELF